MIEDCSYGHPNLWKCMTKQFLILETPRSRIKKSFSVAIPETNGLLSSNVVSEYAMSWHTDTDDLCRPNQACAGIGCLTDNEELSIPLGMYPPIFMTEVGGILSCCKTWLEEYQNSYPRVNFCSGSQSAIKAINSYKFSTSITLQCRDSIQELSQATSVSLMWVPGHMKIP